MSDDSPPTIPTNAANTRKGPDICDALGLIVGIVGVAILFRYGPPQPKLTKGIPILAEQEDREAEARREMHASMSTLALTLILISFVCQLTAVSWRARWIELLWRFLRRALARVSGPGHR